jgi:putative N-acetylmannosamine-6-phosphate epimerase
MPMSPKRRLSSGVAGLQRRKNLGIDFFTTTRHGYTQYKIQEGKQGPG